MVNLYMTFRFNDDEEYPIKFGYIINEKAFATFIGSNQATGTRLVEEEVQFPFYLMNGSARQALVHYTPDGSRFAAYVPVFPTEAEIKNYNEAFGR